MLIRSQDKKRLVNVENVEKIGIYEYERKTDEKGKEVLVYDGGYGKINPNVFKVETSNANLGIYSTEEEAIKVLDMIQRLYEIVNTCNYTKDFSVGTTMAVHNLKSLHVFLMPQESEVE